MRRRMGRNKRPHAISRSAQLALTLFVALASSSCDRKSAPEQQRNRISQPVSDQKGRRVLEASSTVAAEVTRRLIERERVQVSPGSEDPEHLIREYSAASTERKAEILALLGSEGSPGTWDFLCEEAGQEDQNLRLAALDALAVHQGGDPSEVIARSFSFPDEETRALAATLLGKRARDPVAWQKAAIDSSTAVRVTYLAAVENAPTRIKIASAKKALDSGDPQLRREAASVLGGARSKEAADLLISLLDDPDVYPVANDGLFYFFGRGFNSSAEAQAWLSAQKDLTWD